MDINLTGGIVGVICLGFASLATFFLVPDRELTVRERIGINTIFWTFALYAAWTMYIISPTQGLEKILYVSTPIILGLILTILSEFRIKQPPFDVDDSRLKKIAVSTFHRLPHNVKKGIQNTIMMIKEVPQWTDLDIEHLPGSKRNAARWFPILPLPARGIIHISKSDCDSLSDKAISTALTQEFARCYQTTRTPFDADLIEKAGIELPVKWNRGKKIIESTEHTKLDNMPAA